MSTESRQLPLFPLTVTLFPGGTLPLQIFEPRYRALLRDCLAGDERFGVVLIAEGVEVGGPAVPHLTGTIARIAMLEELADGRADLVTVGERRFRIEETWLNPAGYLVGQVVLRPELMDGEPPHLADLVTAVRSTLTDYVDRLSPAAGVLRDELAGMSDPLLLAGLGASLLPGMHTRKQQLLEIDSVPTRLQGIHVLLQRELTLLEMLSRQTEAELRREIISPN